MRRTGVKVKAVREGKGVDAAIKRDTKTGRHARLKSNIKRVAGHGSTGRRGRPHLACLPLLLALLLPAVGRASTWRLINPCLARGK